MNASSAGRGREDIVELFKNKLTQTEVPAHNVRDTGVNWLERSQERSIVLVH